MINNKHFPFRLSLSLTFGAFILCQASLPAQAQRGNQSDVTGLNVTNSDISGGHFSPSRGGGNGRAVFINNTIQISIDQSAGIVLNELTINNLTLPGGESISPETQQLLLNLLTNSPSINTNEIVNALSGSQAGLTKAEVRELVNSLKGLLKTASRKGNNSHIKVNPSKLVAALKAYNNLINNSSAQFLNNPPAALLAVRSVLSQLVSKIH